MRLTPREQDVLDAISSGAFSYKAIARHLGVGVRTAEFHVRSIATKLSADGPPLVAVAMYVASPGIPE